MCASAHDMGNPLSKAIRFDAIGERPDPQWLALVVIESTAG